MLDNETIKKIESFVYAQPRSIQEVSHLLKKSWRTADRYIEQIARDYGTISTKTFRQGTRGALKIAYWASVEKISYSVFQEKLEEEIMRARKKEDFSAFDIFQHVSDKNKKVNVERAEKEELTNLEELSDFLKNTKKQLLIFSGNLSFINLSNKNINILKIFDELVKKNVAIKIICRVDLAGKENIEKMLSLNFKHGKEVIEIRHREQPIRALISDNKIFRIKEIKEPTGKMHELNKKIFIYYTTKDKDWVEWLSRVFWKFFSGSIDSRKRLEEMKKLK